jgi:hypothetical protein
VGNELVNVGGVWTLKEAAAGGAADPTLTYRKEVALSPPLPFGTGHLNANAVEFDGTYGLETPYNAAFDFGTVAPGETSAFSVSLWVYVTSTSVIDGFISNITTYSAPHGWVIYRGWNGLAARCTFYGGSNKYVYGDGPSLTLNNWSHVVVTKAAGVTAGNLNIYVNNVAGTGSVTAVGTMGTIQNVEQLRLGQWYGDAAWDLTSGRIENIGVWNIKLESTDVEELFGAKGLRTVSQINGLSPSTGDVYELTDSGTLTAGSVYVTTGERVKYTGSFWIITATNPPKAASTVQSSNLVAGYLNHETALGHTGSGVWNDSVIDDTSGNGFVMVPRLR